MTRWTGMMLSILMGSMLWSGCSQSTQTEITQTPNELNTLDHLYAQMDGQPQYRRSMRKPVRERQARTRRALERECVAAILSLGAAQGNFSHDLRLTGINPTRETVLELYYNAQVLPWLSVSPDLQWILNPGGEDGRDAFVAGVRFQMAF